MRETEVLGSVFMSPFGSLGTSVAAGRVKLCVGAEKGLKK